MFTVEARSNIVAAVMRESSRDDKQNASDQYGNDQDGIVASHDVPQWMIARQRPLRVTYGPRSADGTRSPISDRYARRLSQSASKAARAPPMLANRRSSRAESARV